MSRPLSKPKPTAEELYHEYIELCIPARVLSRKYGSLYPLLEHLGIPKRGYPLSASQSAPFSQRQLEIVYGKLMGDGFMTVPVRCRWPSLSVEHSIKQGAYVEWLHRELRPFSGKLETYSPRSNYYQGREIRGAGSVRFRTCTHRNLELPFSLFYVNGVKTVSQESLDLLTPLSVAVWIMDDGCLDSDGGLYIATGSLPEESQALMLRWFESRYGVSGRYRHLDDCGYRLSFVGESSKKLRNLVAPHVLEISTMAYKVKSVVKEHGG